VRRGGERGGVRHCCSDEAEGDDDGWCTRALQSGSSPEGVLVLSALLRTHAAPGRPGHLPVGHGAVVHVAALLEKLGELVGSILAVIVVDLADGICEGMCSATRRGVPGRRRRHGRTLFELNSTNFGRGTPTSQTCTRARMKTHYQPAPPRGKPPGSMCDHISEEFRFSLMSSHSVEFPGILTEHCSSRRGKTPSPLSL